MNHLITNNNSSGINSASVPEIQNHLVLGIDSQDKDDNDNDSVVDNKIVAEAKQKFNADITAARNGSDLIAASKALGHVDKKLFALALNRAKKILHARRILDERYSKGGFGSMAQKDRFALIEIISHIDESEEVLQELKAAMLPVKKRTRQSHFLLDPESEAILSKIQPSSIEVLSENDSECLGLQSNINSLQRMAQKRPLDLSDDLSLTRRLQTQNKPISLPDPKPTSALMEQANVELTRQKSLNVKAQRLSEAIHDTTFPTLDLEVQKQIREAYVNAVLGLDN
eukprot:gene3190-6294_t